MTEQNNSGRKRRPVDILFGEGPTPASTGGYVVEQARPATTVSPPDTQDHPTAATVTPASVPESEPPPISPLPPSVPEPIITAPPAAPTDTFAVKLPPDVPEIPVPLSAPEAPAFASSPEPMTPSMRPHAPLFDVPTPKHAEELSERIEQLYEDVKLYLVTSRKATEYCMALLLQARQAHEKQDYAAVEFYTQAVDAKLKRGVRSKQACTQPVMWLLWLWELTTLVLSVMGIAIAYVPALTLFGLPVPAAGILLMRALAWGGVGGAIGAAFNLIRFVRSWEYDPAYTMNYFARPLIGAFLGAVFFLLSQAGLLAGTLILPGNQVGEPYFLYVFAVMGGFWQENVLDFLRELVKTIFRGGKSKPQSK